VWAVLSFTYWFYQRHNPGETLFTVIAYAGYAVLVASWFVLPLGGLLGALLPRLVRGCIGPRAFGRGALLGVEVALIAAVLTTLMMEWSTISGQATIVNRDAWERSLWRTFVFYGVSMSAVCSAWVGVWALRWSRRACA
jgi:ABC-type sugar transport system permease subunit